MATNNVPKEIVIEILSSLPVKLLNRFKVVCKSWKDVIESQDFLKLHFKKSHHTDSYNCSLILCVRSNLYRSHVDFKSNKFNVDKLILPPAFRNQEVEIVGSCNGLVFIVGGEYHFAVCNPALDDLAKAFKILPCMRIKYRDFHDYYVDYHSHSTTKFGFGFDRFSRCYKFVRIKPSRVLVYGMKAGDSWKEVELPFPAGWKLLSVENHGVIVNNYLHWNIMRSDPHLNSKQWCKDTILSFDLHTEEWGEVPVPEGLKDLALSYGSPVGKYITDIGVLDGCLCLLIYGDVTRHSRLDLWVMKEYGVRESWTKWFSVPFGSKIPLVYCKERYEFLLPGTKYGLGWYSPRDDKLTKAEFYGDKFSGHHCLTSRITKCIESFVLPITTRKDALEEEDLPLEELVNFISRTKL